MPDIKDLLEAGVHFGHKTSKWCPKMKPYVWGSRNKVYFIDVSKTAFILEQACQQLKKVASNGGKILWVGTKASAKEAIKKAGEDLDMPRIVHRWIGGTLTNFDQVKKGVTRLLYLKDVVEKPMTNLKKKEIGKLKKEVARLDKNFGGIANLRYPPAALVIVDVKKEATAVKEAISSKIPIIGLVDTNSDPSNLTIAIPTNDDSSKAVELIISTLAQATLAGVNEYKEARKKAKADSKTAVEKALEKESKPAEAKQRAQSKQAIKEESIDQVSAPEVDLPEEILAELDKNE